MPRGHHLAHFGQRPDLRPLHCHQKLVGFFTKLVELSAGAINVTPTEIFDQGGRRPCGTVTIPAKRGGRRGCFPAAQVWRLADGKATSPIDYYGDQAGLDAFWG
jgi:hypothetical protein